MYSIQLQRHETCLGDIWMKPSRCLLNNLLWLREYNSRVAIELTIEIRRFVCTTSSVLLLGVYYSKQAIYHMLLFGTRRRRIITSIDLVFSEFSVPFIWRGLYGKKTGNAAVFIRKRSTESNGCAPVRRFSDLHQQRSGAISPLCARASNLV